MNRNAIDMTDGTPLKLLTVFTVPALAGNLLNQVYSITDSIIVGRVLGQTSLAAIGVCMPVVLLTSTMVIGVNIGVGIIMSQSFGRHDLKTMRHVLANSMYLAFAISLITAVVGYPLTVPILKVMGTPAGPMKEAAEYMHIMFVTTIFPMLYYLFNNAFRGMGDSMTALYCLIVSVGANVILDILFVAKLGLGVAGSAWATALSQFLSVIFAVTMLNLRYKEMRLAKEDFRFDRGLIARITSIAVPVAVQSGFNNLGNIIVQSCINGFGEAVMAAYTAASRIGTLALMPVENVGNSLSVYAGQNFGAGKKERIPMGVRAAWIMDFAVSAVLAAVLLLSGNKLVSLFLQNPAPEILSTASRYLLIAAVPGIFNGIMCIYQQTLRGIDKTNASVAGGFMQLGTKVITAVIGAYVLKNLDIVWLAWPLSFIAGTIYPLTVYKKWEKTADRSESEI
ncbi:MAG: MATE family efflux transporter [Solobacterium sp.]|nr:MATE family efflux transporter [Solobacterium sp.]